MDDRILVGELQFTHLTIPVNAATFVQLTCSKMLRPVVFQLSKPKFQRVRSVDAFRSVRLHRAKKTTLEPCRGGAISFSNALRIRLPLIAKRVSQGRVWRTLN